MNIKMRAWLKQDKVIVEVLEWIHNGRIGVSIDDSGSFIKQPEDVEIMMFTGLSDKQGKEIYEGDIILIPEGFYGDNAMSMTKERKAVVEHDVCDFDDDGSGFYIGLPDDCKWSDCEIIGNIHENPELLESK